MDGDKAWKTLSKRIIHPGKVVHLELEEMMAPDGSEHCLEIVRHSGAAAVVPVGEDGKVVLIRQYRPAVGQRVLEIPAGKLDPGESPLACARRELEEETGRKAESLEPLGCIWTTPGFSSEKIWLFLARDLGSGVQLLEAGEDLEVVELGLEEACSLAEAGEIEDAKTVVALLRARARLASPG